MEKISSNSLKVVEMEKTNLQNSIHSVLVELKNIETHLGLTHISFEQCFNELESRDKHLISTEQSLSKATRQFELIRRSIEIKEKEFHGVQEEFAAEQKLLRESFSGKIEIGQSVYEAIQKWVGERLEEIKAKEEFLEVRGKDLDYKEEKLREKEKGMEMEFKKEIEVIKKKLDFANEFIQQIGKKLESNLLELELKDKELLGAPYLLIGSNGKAHV